LARDIEVFRRIEEAKAPWRAIEAAAHASPFQRYAWIESHLRTISAANGAEPAIVLIRDAAGEPVVILPLEKTRRGGITVLSSIGGKHASFHLPLATPAGEALIAADPAALLRRAAAAAGGADLVVMTSQPALWRGRRNPLTVGGAVEAASRAYETLLPRDAEAFIGERLSGDTRKKLRKKRQALAKLGTVAATRPTKPDAIGRILDAFFAQKLRRFAAQGLANPFAEPETQAFLRQATLPQDREPAAIELYALSCGDRTTAVFGLATGFGRASGMFTSFDDDDPAVARCSPGDLLLQDMVRDLVARGFTEFDLGVGEARYKNAFCANEVVLVDSFMPLTLYGRLGAAVLETASRMKAAVKRDPRLMNAANRLRAVVRRKA
jgi:CelD/BcsL family acetyltransferase involved in cellulose biosynthesis